MSNKNITDIKQIIQRLKIELNVDTQSELAEKLGYKAASSISNWKIEGRGIDWNRILERHPSLDVNFVKYGVKKENTATHKSIDEKWNRLEDAVNEQDISYEVRDRIAASLQDRAKNLAKDLEYFSDLIAELRSSRSDDS